MTSPQTFYGSLVALVTPMQADGAVDYPAIDRLIDFHLREGTDGLVMVGTTGESPTVNFDEHQSIIEHAVRYGAGRIPIIAGTGANATDEAIHLTQFAEKTGAHAALSVVPYYNKPTQEGMYRHFRAIAESTKLPIILYNVPGRTVADISNDTVLRLSEIPNIIGIKDATGDMNRGADLLRRVPQDFLVLSGDDATTLPLMLLGAKGTISVVANVAPRAMHEMCACALAQQWDRARQWHFQLMPLHQKLFVEANPIPVKWALQKMGLIDSGIRLPLSPLSESAQAIVHSALQESAILSH